MCATLMIKMIRLMLLLVLLSFDINVVVLSIKAKVRTSFVRSITSIVRTSNTPGVSNSKVNNLFIISIVISTISMHPFASFADSKLPKMEYFIKENDVKVGNAVYNEIDLSVVDSKLKVIINEWNNMINRVEISLQKNKKSDAQISISNTMGSIKINMRQLAKILNNGDIIVRNENGNELNAEFNFNTGQFKLRPIAQKTEDVINAVNDFYFYESQETAESSLLKLNNLKKLFDEWVQVIKS